MRVERRAIDRSALCDILHGDCFEALFSEKRRERVPDQFACSRYPPVVAEYGGALADKVIIDITNPINPDATGMVTPAGSSGAQEIAKGAPASAHVVKAFNTIFGQVLAKGGRLDAFIAADDPEAKARVSTFIESLNLRPLDVGGLQMAQTLEALGLMLIGVAENGAGSWDIAFHIDIG